MDQQAIQLSDQLLLSLLPFPLSIHRCCQSLCCQENRTTKPSFDLLLGQIHKDGSRVLSRIHVHFPPFPHEVNIPTLTTNFTTLILDISLILSYLIFTTPTYKQDNNITFFLSLPLKMVLYLLIWRKIRRRTLITRGCYTGSHYHIHLPIRCC